MYRAGAVHRPTGATGARVTGAGRRFDGAFADAVKIPAEAGASATSVRVGDYHRTKRTYIQTTAEHKRFLKFSFPQ
jgi:hypothetical protein